MNTLEINQIEDFTKQTCLENNSYSVSDIKEHNEIPVVPLTNLPKQQENTTDEKKKISFIESESTRKSRLNSLSHWPHSTPSSESLASAGWFGCNVTDRVICIYCNTICHEWTINDDPTEVHRRLAPTCPFILSILPKEQTPKIINDNMLEKFSPTHPAMSEVSRREATFTNNLWTESSPSIESLVRAGFFCPGISNTVTCFYCNGSLHKWGTNDNPMIEHARWFPHCTYAKHLCGDNLYQKIQMTKKPKLSQNHMSQEDISRYVASRLDLPIVGQLRSKYTMAVIKRCLEDQWKIKNDDFKSDTDFHMACFILQKQIDHIKGRKDKLIVPSAQRIELENLTKPSKSSLGECLICLTEEKQLACMPCGHLCACVSCGYSLKSCPVCREKIQAFMRINC